MVRFRVDNPTNEQVQKMILDGVDVGHNLIRIKVPKGTCEQDYEIKDEKGKLVKTGKTIREELQVVERADAEYITIGRSRKTAKGNPTGNYEYVPKEEIQKYIDLYGIENICVDLPKEEIVERFISR